MPHSVFRVIAILAAASALFAITSGVAHASMPGTGNGALPWTLGHRVASGARAEFVAPHYSTKEACEADGRRIMRGEPVECFPYYTADITVWNVTPKPAPKTVVVANDDHGPPLNEAAYLIKPEVGRYLFAVIASGWFK